MRIPPFVDIWSLSRKKRFYLFQDQKIQFLPGTLESLPPDKRAEGDMLRLTFGRGGVLSVSTDDPIRSPIIIAGSRVRSLDVVQPLFFSFVGYEVFIDNLGCESDFWFTGYLSRKTREYLACSRQDSTVFIIGDTGTGKELLAKNLHYNSIRRYSPFVAVNCASLCAETAERELFGNIKGAFTSGKIPSKGVFMNTGPGTIFLDNIEDLPMNVQPMLLRALELQEVKASGSNKSKKHKARVMVSSSLSPRDLLYGGLIRKDLYYRIEETCLYLPELKTMKDEIKGLLGFYMGKDYTSEEGLEDHLYSYDWPGNLREFRNAVERAKMMAVNDKKIKRTQFNLDNRSCPKIETIRNPYLIYPFENEERNFILGSLLSNSWNIVDTARELNLCRSTLMAKIDYYGLKDQN